MTEKILKKEERVAFALREEYERYGYRQYKMNKFEEYDLYVRNKDFLISENIITFTDTTGKLMALKPDVTLSIIKNCATATGEVQKVYYNENVYRVSPSNRCFKEIFQAGLECMGDIDNNCIYEVVLLAVKSLAAIGDGGVLSIAHLGLLQELLAQTTLDEANKRLLCRCISEKNLHELKALCTRLSLSPSLSDILCRLITLYGAPTKVLPALQALLPQSPALRQLETVLSLFETGPYASMLRIDFGGMDDMTYYNGILFKGYIYGVPESVLSGGQYDNLMHRFDANKGAIGFAVYLDRLERLEDNKEATDADILLLYDDTEEISLLQQTAEELRKEGSVMLQRSLPPKLRFGKILKLSGGKVQPL